MKNAVTTTIALVALALSISAEADASTIKPFEFEGIAQSSQGNQHFSYVFLAESKTVVRLDFNSEGQVSRISHGTYSMSPKRAISICWSCGKLERGNFSSCGKQYCTECGEGSQVSKGCWQNVTDPTRLRFVDVYIRAQQQSELTREFHQMASGRRFPGPSRGVLFGPSLN